MKKIGIHRRSPFFYVGDKFKLVPQLKENFPRKIDKFIEPFCGGGSVFLNTEAKRYLLNDIDPYVIELHRFLIARSSNVQEFWEQLRVYVEKYSLSATFMGRGGLINTEKNLLKPTLPNTTKRLIWH